MPAILPSIPIDNDTILAKFFMLHQIHWIQAEDAIHARHEQAFALAEKSVRIGWTYADAFKNVRKRLRFKKRDYLFATKDYPSALEFMRVCKEIAELFSYTGAILSHGEEFHKLPRLGEDGRSTGFTDETKMGVIKFDNGSRILAFSSHPQAMAVYAGDVGLDEFAKHSNAHLLWETAQGRVTWGYDMAVWSSHDGEDTLFNEFAHEARASFSHLPSLPQEESAGEGRSEFEVQSSTFKVQSSPTPHSSLPTPHSALLSPWNLYYRVTMPDALELGLLQLINQVRGTQFTADQFLADCRARARQEEIFQQAYLCNPKGAATNRIVDWSVIERCRYDYQIIRTHLEHAQILDQFGQFTPDSEGRREQQINAFIHRTFLKLFQTKSQYRLGFDVAASGQGDLAAIYIDELNGQDLWLRALFTCRTEDWHFLKTVLSKFLRELRSLQAAGDESGLGRQVCWEAASRFPGTFTKINFASKKHDLGFALMNQLATAQKRFPRAEQDIAADFFALRKNYAGTRWVFSEGRNPLNAASHCDIAWAGALATHIHTQRSCEMGAEVW